MRYNALEKKLVIELYDKTGNIDYVKTITGISKKTISTWIKDNGYDMEPVKRGEKYIIAHSIFGDIYNGYSLNAIMKKRGMTKLELLSLMEYYSRVSLSMVKVNKREILNNKNKLEVEKMIENIENGQTTISRIAKENNVTISAISKRISRHKEKWGNING